MTELAEAPVANPTCGFCRRRGDACKKHGGISSQSPEYKSSNPRHHYSSEVAGALERKAASGIASVPIKMPTGDFPDPYGCSMCARKGSFCDIHERLQLDKQKREGVTTESTTAPVSANSGAIPPETITPGGVKATEQHVGEFRVVQIKVGDVTITVKEPFREPA